MALTGAEKNSIAQGVISFQAAAVPEVAGLGLAGAGFIGLAFLPLALGLQQQFSRVRFPKLNLGSVLQEKRNIEARGLQARVSPDPFFGDVIVSARDQDFFLGEIIRNRALRRVAASLSTRPIFEAREALIKGLADTAVERGFFENISDIPQGLRGFATRETADSPIRFVPV